MKTIVAITIGLLFAGIAAAQDVYVRPYVTKNGTYVQGHHRSSPNSTTFDNYSTKGNFNPYTGQAGTVDPFNSQNKYRPVQLMGQDQGASAYQPFRRGQSAYR